MFPDLCRQHPSLGFVTNFLRIRYTNYIILFIYSIWFEEIKSTKRVEDWILFLDYFS